jgi:hypothetical protein
VGRPGLHRQRRAGCEPDPLRLTIQIVGGIKPQGPFIQPRRWVVERIFWVHCCPRRTRQDEQTLLAHEAMVVSSQIALMLRRLDRTREPRP